ncbi:MAG: hypothetical protein JNK05_33700 [Myxococcales bacterium]|nr:hypothetical protein [Myxococcales bacterium]
MRSSVVLLSLALALASSCRRSSESVVGDKPLEFGIASSPMDNGEHAPWVEPSDRALGAAWLDARRAFAAGFPDPIGRRYARCGDDVGFVVAVPGGVAVIDWRGSIRPCDDARDVERPFPGESFGNVARALSLDASLARRNPLTRALILRTNIGADALANAPARHVRPFAALEAWAEETWRVALSNYVGEARGATAERALFFTRASLAAVGVFERTSGPTRTSDALWFAPTAAALARQLDDRVEDAGAAEPLPDGGRDAGQPRIAVSVARRWLADSRFPSRTLRERYAPSPGAPRPSLEWVAPALHAVLRRSDAIEPMLELLARGEAFVPVRVVPFEHPERVRPARLYELAYHFVATALAFDPIFEEIAAGADETRPRTDSLAAHRAFVAGDRRALEDLVARFRVRMDGATSGDAELARAQLANESLSAIAAAAAQRLPAYRANPRRVGEQQARYEARVARDAELIVRRAAALFESHPAWSCAVLDQLERVAPMVSSEAHAALVDRFAREGPLTVETASCVARVLRPRAGEAQPAVEERYVRWIRRAGPLVYAASPCDSIAHGPERTLSIEALRAHAIAPLEALRRERAPHALLRALVRWVRPEAIRCASHNPTYFDWVRVVLARAVPVGSPVSDAVRTGEPWGRRRRCPVVHDGYARGEGRIPLRDLAGIAHAFAETREPCALADRAPTLDGWRFALEAQARRARDERANR